MSLSRLFPVVSGRQLQQLMGARGGAFVRRSASAVFNGLAVYVRFIIIYECSSSGGWERGCAWGGAVLLQLNESCLRMSRVTCIDECVAVCCSALCCGAVCCSVLQCAAVW